MINKHEIEYQRIISELYKALNLACNVLRTGSTDIVCNSLKESHLVVSDQLEDYFIEKARVENGN